jgi:hypothetical protein
MYQLVKKDNETISVRKTEGAFVKVIPFDPANTDYQAYLAWVAEGNTPEPAEENT